MDKFPITYQGYTILDEEVRHLRNVERPSITKQIAEARELGDLSENAEYHAAREKQSFCEGRIQELEDKKARAEIIDVTKLSGNTVKFGAVVNLIDEDDKEVIYQIVGEYEANVEKGLISIASPLARALISKELGAEVEVITPKGAKSYEIAEIHFHDKFLKDLLDESLEALKSRFQISTSANNMENE